MTSSYLSCSVRLWSYVLAGGGGVEGKTMPKVEISVWDPPEADLETGIQVQMVYLGGWQSWEGGQGSQ